MTALLRNISISVLILGACAFAQAQCPEKDAERARLNSEIQTLQKEIAQYTAEIRVLTLDVANYENVDAEIKYKEGRLASLNAILARIRKNASSKEKCKDPILIRGDLVGGSDVYICPKTDKDELNRVVKDLTNKIGILNKELLDLYANRANRDKLKKEIARLEELRRLRENSLGRLEQDLIELNLRPCPTATPTPTPTPCVSCPTPCQTPCPKPKPPKKPPAQ